MARGVVDGPVAIHENGAVFRADLIAGQAADERRRIDGWCDCGFDAAGWAHHPYELAFAPTQAPRNRDFVTIANLAWDRAKILPP